MPDMQDDLRMLVREVGQMSRILDRLQGSVDGTHNSPGLVKTVDTISIRQEADSKLIRLGLWLPTIISFVSLFISLTAITIALIAFYPP